jgi:hypothetical protein
MKHARRDDVNPDEDSVEGQDVQEQIADRLQALEAELGAEGFLEFGVG